MTKKTLPIGDIERIIVENVAGDLTLRGWNRDEISLQGFMEEKVEREGTSLRLSSTDDAILSLPYPTPIEIRNVTGDANIKGKSNLNLSAVGGDLLIRDVDEITVREIGSDFSAVRVRGDLELNNVGGDCTLHDIKGQFSVNAIGGDLSAKGVQEDALLKSVGGDVVFQDLSGQFSAKSIGGDLDLRKISGGFEAKVGGEAVLTFSPVPWQAYAIQAGGTIYTKIPEDSQADFNLKSEAEVIKVHLKEKSKTIHEQAYQFQLGDGGPSVNLSAGGEIILASEESEWFPGPEVEVDFLSGLGNMAEEIAQQTTQQIEEQLAHLEEHLSTHLSGLSETLESAGLTEEKTQEVMQRVEEARQRAAHKAQKAKMKLARELIKAQRKAARKARREKRQAQEIDVEALFAQKEKARGIASEEERMMILKMLQEKKITTKQANDLLAALEGKE